MVNDSRIRFEYQQKAASVVFNNFSKDVWQDLFGLAGDFCTDGILNDTQFPISVTAIGTPSYMTVGAGVGYKTGKRIVIETTDALTYDTSRPLNPVTPNSTGHISIPIPVRDTNYYVWIRHLWAADTTNTGITKSGNVVYYQWDNGYEITLTTVLSAPATDYIYLGRVSVSSGGVASVSLGGRAFMRANFPQYSIDYKDSCYLATISGLTATYDSVAQTLTAAGTGILAIDGLNPGVDARVLVKDQVSDPEHNGIYTVLDTGSMSTPWILQRALDFNTSTLITNGAFVYVASGTNNNNTGWILTTQDPITLDTTPLYFNSFAMKSVIGTGAATEVTYWTGTNTIAGSPQMTYDGAGTLSVPTLATDIIKSYSTLPITISATTTVNNPYLRVKNETYASGIQATYGVDFETVAGASGRYHTRLLGYGANPSGQITFGNYGNMGLGNQTDADLYLSDTSGFSWLSLAPAAAANNKGIVLHGGSAGQLQINDTSVFTANQASGTTYWSVQNSVYAGPNQYVTGLKVYSEIGASGFYHTSIRGLGNVPSGFINFGDNSFIFPGNDKESDLYLSDGTETSFISIADKSLSGLKLTSGYSHITMTDIKLQFDAAAAQFNIASGFVINSTGTVTPMQYAATYPISDPKDIVHKQYVDSLVASGTTLPGGSDGDIQINRLGLTFSGTGDLHWNSATLSFNAGQFTTVGGTNSYALGHHMTTNGNQAFAINLATGGSGTATQTNNGEFAIFNGTFVVYSGTTSKFSIDYPANMVTTGLGMTVNNNLTVNSGIIYGSHQLPTMDWGTFDALGVQGILAIVTGTPPDDSTQLLIKVSGVTKMIQTVDFI